MTADAGAPPDHIETIAVHAGRDHARQSGAVNPPIQHASTILFDRMDDYDRRRELFYDGIGYGLYATPTMQALAEAVAALEGATRTVVTSSGTAAIATALTALTRQGAHILVPDTVYGPTRSFCDEVLARFGVDTTYYDPRIGADIESYFRTETTLVFLESPGSMTFEVQDVPTIAACARARGLTSVIDATWASPVFMRGLDLGVDIAIQSGTKYLSGHSDVMFGTLSTRNEPLFRTLKDCAGRFGNRLGGDDCYLAMRGLRTLPVRMRQHQQSALILAHRFRDHPAVKRVLYPALDGDPGHALWKRDCSGASGLFGLVFRTPDRSAIARIVESLRLFRMGSSWGGFESLAVPAYPATMRTATKWSEPGFLLRVHAGLENVEDLWADCKQALG